MYLILCFTLLTRKRITFLFMFIILFLTGVRFLITLQEYTVTWQFKHRYSGLEWWNIKYSAFKVKWIILLHCCTKPSKGFGHSFCVSNWTSKQGASENVFVGYTEDFTALRLIFYSKSALKIDLHVLRGGTAGNHVAWSSSLGRLVS